MVVDGDGLGTTRGRLSFAFAGFVFELPRLTLTRGVSSALSTAFALERLAFGVRLALAGLFAFAFAFAFALPLVLPFVYPLVFLFLGGLGLSSFVLLELVLAFRLSLSTGLTVSEASPSFATLLMSIATV